MSEYICNEFREIFKTFPFPPRFVTESLNAPVLTKRDFDRVFWFGLFAIVDAAHGFHGGRPPALKLFPVDLYTIL